MSAGYGDYDPDALIRPEGTGGLDDFDVDDASQRLARAGQIPVDAVSGGAAPDAEPGTVSPVADANDAESLTAPSANGAPADATPDSTATVYNLGAPVDTRPDPNAPPQPPQFAELGPPPPPPAPTGDPQKDVAANMAWQRQLVEHHGELTKRQTALATHAASVGAMRGKKEAEVAAVEAERKTAIAARYQQELERRRGMVDDAVTARTKAYGDLEGAKWDRPHTGAEILAIILGGLGAALQNSAAAKIGQVGHAENEAVKAIDVRMRREYDVKKMKLAAAGDALLSAQWGYKTSAENQRAAINNLDAEMAAKYKLIAKEAESQLLAQGVPAAQAKGNALIVDSLQKAAAHEGDILNREEGHAAQREQAGATLELARANLGERKQEFSTNMGERRQEFSLRRQDAAEARAAREAAAREKKEKHEIELSDKKEARLFRDPRTNEPVGYAPNAKAVSLLADKASAVYAYVDKAREFADHIEKHQGDPQLMNPYSDLYKERETIAADTRAMGRPAKGINATDAGAKLEHQIVGGDGLGLNRTANPKVLRKLADDAEKQLMFKLRAGLDPVEGAKGISLTPEKKGFDAPGGVKYELGADGNYHKVK